MEWFSDPFARQIWEAKYAGIYKQQGIAIFFLRLAERVAQGDKEKTKRYFSLMYDKKFSPGGRILAAAGRPQARMSLMNCTTHWIESDSLEAISDTAYTIMRSSSRGQGIGIDLSALRPKGARVNNAAATSSGATSFMEMLNQVGGTIGQEGRRAALLFSLAGDHPDLWRKGEKDIPCPRCQGKGCFQCGGAGYIPYDFLHVKSIPGRVENANISVLISDAFLQAVKNDGTLDQNFMYQSGGQEWSTGRTVSARELMREIARSAYRSAEPGLLYWDTSRRMSNSDLLGERWKIVGVNACSEETLDQDGVCNLGSINLGAYVRNPFPEKAYFDFSAFSRDVASAVEFLDDVLDVELASDNSISETQKRSILFLRRIGLGVMGLADALAGLGLPYGDGPRTGMLIDSIFRAMRDAAYWQTIDLAKRKGPCKAWTIAGNDHSSIVKQGFFGTLDKTMQQAILRYGVRNITTLSMAPTGSISNLFGASSGIEPLFARQYTRRVRMNGKDEFIDYVHPGLRASRGAGLPDEIWRTAYEVSPAEHVNVQAIIQQYVDASISKTVNLPATSLPEDVENIYLKGWKLGLKGMSIYVDGSRDQQVLYADDEGSGESTAEYNDCPVCGSLLIQESGCKKCSSCEWSVCS